MNYLDQISKNVERVQRNNAIKQEQERKRLLLSLLSLLLLLLLLLSLLLLLLLLLLLVIADYGQTAIIMTTNSLGDRD